MDDPYVMSEADHQRRLAETYRGSLEMMRRRAAYWRRVAYLNLALAVVQTWLVLR